MENKPILTDDEMERYSRQLLLKQIGIKGQQSLKNKSVLLIGAGGLSSPVGLYLSGAGVGTIGVIDGDTIELSNLHRQIMFKNNDLGHSKAKIASRAIRELNPNINVITYENYITSDTATKIINEYDVIVNGSDNFITRYIVNDTCVALSKTLVDASVVMSEGQIAVYTPGNGCYRCLYPDSPQDDTAPSCSNSGVFGPMVGVMGSLQAMEVIKILLNIGNTYDSRLIYYDAISGDFQTLKRTKNPNCPTCGKDKSKLGGATYGKKQNINKEKTNQIEHIYEIKPLQLNVLKKDKSFQILDIRNDFYYDEGHIKDSLKVNEVDIYDYVKEINESQKIVVVCQIGKVSRNIQKKFKAEGISNVYSLEGGIINWERYKLPIISKNNKIND